MAKFLFKSSLILVLVVGVINGQLIWDPLNLKGLCDAFKASEISGAILCPAADPFSVISQQSCDKHCQCAHAANYGTCTSDQGSTAVYCHCIYDSPAPAGYTKWTTTDPICAGWSNIAVTVLCNVTQHNVLLPLVGKLLPLCYLDCPCIHNSPTFYGKCGADPDGTGEQRCFCNQAIGA